MKIVIPGNPIPKQRARHARKGGKIITFDPQKAEKNWVKSFLREEIKKIESLDVYLPFKEVYFIRLSFYLQCAVSESYRHKNAKLWGLTSCNKKPDLDNLAKFILDCANEVLYQDDSSITHCEMIKKYSENPRTEIEIMSKKEFNLNDKTKNILQEINPRIFKEFINDAKEIYDIGSIFLDLKTEIDEFNLKEDNLIQISEKMNNFSLKYAKLLKKIESIGALSCKKENEKPFINGKPLC